MNINCPHCGTEYEVEKKDMYRYTKCEVCGKGFVVGAETSMLSSKNGSTSTEASTHAPKGGRFTPRHSQGFARQVGNVTLPGRFARPRSDAPPSPAQSAMTKSKSSPRKKAIAIIVGIVGLLLVVSVAAFVSYLYFGDEPRLGRGVAYYEKGFFPKAYKLLFPLAKKGYAKAQLLVGDCYANGQGVFMDTEEAVKWYRAAADQELPEAQYKMFACCRDGVGMERNQANAAKWCRKAADSGHKQAMFDMAMLYVNGTGVEQNEKSAFKWFRKGSEAGHPFALYKLGQCYKHGFGTEKDEDEASKWQNKAVSVWQTKANAGDADSMFRLAKLYMEGDVVELDKEEAVRWFRKAAEAGEETAQFELATCYHKGEGTDEDQEEAAKWMQKAASKSKNRLVQWAMARYYQEGWGVEKNMSEAVKWFERSANNGFSPAKYYLAMCYLQGEGVLKDEAKAEQILEDASVDGNEDAKKELIRIKRKRAEEEARLEREQKEKWLKIEHLSEIEKTILEWQCRINAILKGELKGDWTGFDAGKITSIDGAVSVAEEPSPKMVASNLSAEDEMSKIDRAIQFAENESVRLRKRLDNIIRIKDVYFAKELESRKERCTPCGGTGTVECARCKGSGEVISKNRAPCPTCVGSRGDDGDDFSGSGFASSGSGHRGQIRKQVVCGNCRGNGQIRQKCGTCNGKKKVAIEEPGRMRRYERCSECNGSGYGYPETCPRCDGSRKLEVWQTCATCQGRGEVANGSKVTCPVCGGKCKLTCERCGGKGFTYRPKQ